MSKWLVRATYQRELAPKVEGHSYDDCIDPQECGSCSSHSWEMINDGVELTVEAPDLESAKEQAQYACTAHVRTKWEFEKLDDRTQCLFARVLSITPQD